MTKVVSVLLLAPLLLIAPSMASAARRGKTVSLPATARTRSAELSNGPRQVRFTPGLVARVSGGSLGRVTARTLHEGQLVHRTRLRARGQDLELYAQHQLGAPDGKNQAGPQRHASLRPEGRAALRSALGRAHDVLLLKHMFGAVGMTQSLLLAVIVATDRQPSDAIGAVTLGAMGLITYLAVRIMNHEDGVVGGNFERALKDDTLIRSLP